MKGFLCDRLVPVTRTLIEFVVDTLDGVEAATVADEVAYAAAWVEGSYPDREHRKKPDQECLGLAEDALGMPRGGVSFDAHEVESVGR